MRAYLSIMEREEGGINTDRYKVFFACFQSRRLIYLHPEVRSFHIKYITLHDKAFRAGKRDLSDRPILRIGVHKLQDRCFGPCVQATDTSTDNNVQQPSSLFISNG
jgi:hypothetical protein